MFEESAGAGSVASHLTMPRSWGLLSSAAMESGAFADWIVQPVACAQSAYEALRDKAGCSDLDCLLHMAASDLQLPWHYITRGCPL